MTIQRAAVVLGCEPEQLDATLTFFCDRLGFRVDAILPAHAPAIAELSGHGLRIRLEPAVAGIGPGPGTLRLICTEPAKIGQDAVELEAPNGTRVLLVEPEPELVVPPIRPTLVIARLAEGGWGEGRAGINTAT